MNISDAFRNTRIDTGEVRNAMSAVSDYITRRYGSNRNRHWWGIAHRQWLLNSGRYIKTSERDQDCIDRTLAALRLFNGKIVGEQGPELARFRD